MPGNEPQMLGQDPPEREPDRSPGPVDPDDTYRFHRSVVLLKFSDHDDE